MADFDFDAVNVVAAAANHAKIGATKVRYGRLRIDNAYGSDLLDMPVALTAQYWNGARYAANADDNCTPLAAANFTVAAGAGAAIATALKAGATMLNGVGANFRLARPNPAPSGKGSETFGLYKSGAVIFLREMY